MSKLPALSSFTFRLAHYVVKDDHGNEAVLKINYQDNRYELEAVSKRLTSKFVTTIDEVAISLLQRKHGQNFVERVLRGEG